jgi:UDP-glucose 4-epimerase
MPKMGLRRLFSPGQILLFAVIFSGYVQHMMALAAPSPRTVLVTGGAGYIGSHTCLELLNEEENVYNVVVIDNLENASEESLKRVQALTGCDKDRLQFRNCDIRDKEGLKRGKIVSKRFIFSFSPYRNQPLSQVQIFQFWTNSPKSALAYILLV